MKWKQNGNLVHTMVYARHVEDPELVGGLELMGCLARLGRACLPQAGSPLYACPVAMKGYYL